MKLISMLGVATLAMLASNATAQVVEQEKKVELKVGDKAPAFKMKGSDGKDYTLAQYKGKKGVVIAWFPKAFTGG